MDYCRFGVSPRAPFIGYGMNYSKGDLWVSFGKSLAKKYYGIKQKTHWSRKSQWGMAVIEESHVFSLDIWSRDGWDTMQSVRNLSTLRSVGDTRRLTFTQAAVIHIWKQKTLQPGEKEFCSCQVADGTNTRPQLFSAFLHESLGLQPLLPVIMWSFKITKVKLSLSFSLCVYVCVCF